MWRRWGWVGTPSWPECCCWRAEQTDPSMAFQSDLEPVRSASAGLFLLLEPIKTECPFEPRFPWEPHQPAAAQHKVNLHRCSRSIAGRRGRPRRRACFWNSTDPGSAELCSPRHAPVVPERRRHLGDFTQHFASNNAADWLLKSVDFYWPHRKRCPVCRACNTEPHRQTRSAVHGVCMCNKDNSQLWMTQSGLNFFLH